ncbi:MAG: flagellar motor switch protein FliN [Candidatus Hydrogenedentes bacterium]|nr:flagellar motor switch protein FliN [Candidatus Hydrogenedentota bacterium]
MEPLKAAKKKPEAATNDTYSRNLDMVLDIRLVATARLGRIEMPISEILSLGPGSIIEVGHLVDEPVELLVNDKLIARGDVVVVDEKFGLRITEIVSPRERIESLR